MSAFAAHRAALAVTCRDTFGEPLTYYPGGDSAGVPVTGIWREPFAEALGSARRRGRASEGPGVSTSAPMVKVLAADCTTPPEQGDRLRREADGRLYEVDDVRPAEPGRLLLVLKRAR